MAESSTTEYLGRALLAEKRSSGQEQFEMLDPADDLQSRYRWMVVNISNETQFSLSYEKEWFDVGRFWDAPTTTKPFGHSGYSGCNTDLGSWGFHGVSGAALFHLQTPGRVVPITVAFSNPGTGNIKTRAEFSSDLKQVWDNMDEQCTTNDNKGMGECLNKANEKVRVALQLTSTPGNQARVTLTQKYDVIDTKAPFEFMGKDEFDARKAGTLTLFDTIDPIPKLKEKYRWMVVSIINETQFTLRYEKEWFDVGRFWDAPGNVKAFGCSHFSGCSTYWGAKGFHGVSAAALFNIQIPGLEQAVTIAFSNPGTGSIKARADFSSNMKDVWDKMEEQRTYVDTFVMKSSYTTKKNEKVHVTFKLTATPGNQAKVVLTQIYE